MRKLTVKQCLEGVETILENETARLRRNETDPWHVNHFVEIGTKLWVSHNTLFEHMAEHLRIMHLKLLKAKSKVTK
jgi:hypothetical protein